MGEVRLYYGPAGCGKTRLAVRRLAQGLGGIQAADLLFDFRPRHLFLAADADQAQAVRQALLTDPGVRGLVGPSVVTFGGLYDLIFRLAGQTPPDALSDVARLALLRRTLSELAGEGALKLTDELRSRPGFLRALDGFLQELKQGEIEPEKFSRALDDFGRDDRGHDLEVIYQRYQQALTGNGLYDAAGLSWQARALLPEAADGFASLSLLVVDGFVTFTPTQETILKQLADWASSTVFTLTYEDDEQRRELYHHARKTYELLTGDVGAHPEPLPLPQGRPATLAHLERHLFRSCESYDPGATPTIPPDADQLQIISAPGDWREALEIAREIKALVTRGRYRPGDVVVLCRSRRHHGPLLERACAQLGVPLQVGSYRGLLQASVVRSFLKALQLPLDEWPRQDVSEVLVSPYLKLSDGLPAGDVEALAARAFVVRGQQQWSTNLTRLREQLSEEAEDFDDVELPPDQVRDRRRTLQVRAQECVRVEALFARLSQALGCVPARAPLAQFVAFTQELIETLDLRERVAEVGALRARRDLAGLAALEEVLGELASQPGADELAMSLSEFVGELEQALSEPSLPEPHASSQAVRLLEVYEARGVHAPVVFIVGLLEGTFPAAPITRTFYDERERRRLSQLELTLEQEQDTQCREMLYFYQAVTRATERLYLTYPATDSRGKAQLRSHFIDDVEELLKDPARRPAGRRSVRLSDWPPEPDQVGGTEELLERWVVDVAENPGALSAEARSAAVLLRGGNRPRLETVCDGALQLRQREGIDGLDAHDGVLLADEAKALLADRFGPDYVYSASQFDHYARCPFAFFLKYVLGLEAPQAPPERLEPVDLGSLCHTALARLHRRCLSAGRTVWDDLTLTEDMLKEDLPRLFSEGLRRELGLTKALAEVYRGEVRELLLRTLREHPEEEGFRGLLPGHFELAFGPSREAEVDRASRQEPLALDVEGEGVLVRGRIDRVDVGAERPLRYGVLDYKLSSAASVADICSGRNTQLSLYLAACQQLFFPEATCEVAGFLSLSYARFSQPIRATPTSRSLTPEDAGSYLRRYLAAYVRAMRSGLFPPAPADERVCSTCDFAGACRPEGARIERKLGPGGREELLGLVFEDGEEAS